MKQSSTHAGPMESPRDLLVVKRYTAADFDSALSLVDTLPSDPVARLERLGLPGLEVMRYARVQAGNVSEVLRSQQASADDAYALGWLDALVIGLALGLEREEQE